MTRPFIAAILLFGPVIGAEASILLSLAALLGLLQFLNHDFPITKSGPQRSIFRFILIWFATEALFGLLHFNGWRTIIEIAENLPFLGYIILVSGMEYSSKADLRRVAHFAAPAAAFCALAVASVQIQIGPSRAEGGAGNAGPFAALCLIVFGCCLLAAIETKGRARILGAAGAGAAAVCVVLSGTKGLWPALAALPLALAALHWPTVKASFKSLAPGAAIIGLVVIALTHGTVENRISRLEAEIAQTNSAVPSSLGERLRIWKAGWRLFIEAPFSGHGLGRNSELMAERTGGPDGANLAYSHFHNAILTQGVQSGVCGLAALAAMFFAPPWLAARRQRDEYGRHGYSVIVIASLVYAISGLTGIMFGHDLMDMGWIAAISYGSFQVFGKGSQQDPADGANARLNDFPAGSRAS